MIIFVYGGSGSGKSSYAENRINDLAFGCDKYYLATMQVYDDEGARKVARHRDMRKNAGYITIEQPVNIHKATQYIKRRGAALLEDMGNLVANEMFQDELFYKRKPDEISSEELLEHERKGAERITESIKALAKSVDIIVIVSNNVFEDGMEYDETTKSYMRCLASVNMSIAAVSDEVIEVVAGIPVIIKSKGIE